MYKFASIYLLIVAAGAQEVQNPESDLIADDRELADHEAEFEDDSDYEGGAVLRQLEDGDEGGTAVGESVGDSFDIDPFVEDGSSVDGDEGDTEGGGDGSSVGDGSSTTDAPSVEVVLRRLEGEEEKGEEDGSQNVNDDADGSGPVEEELDDDLMSTEGSGEGDADPPAGDGTGGSDADSARERVLYG